MNDGFIYVASVDRLYYELALNSCESLRDHYPDAKVTLFTHKNFVDDRAEKLFNTIITDIPVHVRAKMWGMARTPYDRTVYIDCDSLIVHRDIRKIHDFLDDCDLFCGDNQIYTISNIKLAYIDKDFNITHEYHGSMWGYTRSPICIDFMQTWFDEYVKQLELPEWKYEHFSDIIWKPFDMYTLWRLITNHFEEGFDRFQDLNIKILPTRWNCCGQTLPKYLNGPKVIIQIDKYTLEKSSPEWWKDIKRKSSDVQYQVNKSKAKKSSFDCN